MKYRALVFLLFATLHGFSQKLDFWQFEINIGTGLSFQETLPQKQNDYNRKFLNARHKRDNFLRLKVQSPKLFFDVVSFSCGFNYGEVSYVQPVFNSASGVGANGYNTIVEYFHFSRNYISSFLGLSTNLNFYDGAILLSGGLHLAHSRFVNSNRRIGTEDYRTWTSNVVNKFSYRYSMEIKDKNAPVILDLDIALKFRLSPSLYLNFGLNYVGGRKMEYDYFYEFKSYTASTDTWTEPQTHVNFNHLEQPLRIDHVFYLSSGISYTPQFKKKNKE